MSEITPHRSHGDDGEWELFGVGDMPGLRFVVPGYGPTQTHDLMDAPELLNTLTATLKEVRESERIHKNLAAQYALRIGELAAQLAEVKAIARQTEQQRDRYKAALEEIAAEPPFPEDIAWAALDNDALTGTADDLLPGTFEDWREVEKLMREGEAKGTLDAQGTETGS